MSIKFFSNITNLSELKKEYRKLCKKYHPDLSHGCTETMKIINNEYEYLFKQLQHSSTDQAEQQENVNTYKDIINSLIKYDNINIEIVGTWIWLDGNTYAIKEQIKELNFKWSKKRKKWYYAADLDTKKKKGTNLQFDEIRMRYGSKTIKSNSTAKKQLA